MKNSADTTVVVGMSGGVDSSVVACMLKEQGYRVIGLFMKNWEESDEHGICKASKEYDDVVSVCQTLDIPHYAVNFAKEYRENVFSHFLEEFQKGYTPNPDILCNREIKFKVLLEKAFELGADYLATGHYCRACTEPVQLLKGSDPAKDQSYFLHAISGKVLNHVLFPLGAMRKQEVRSVARAYGLSTAEKKDSTGICFIGKRNFKQFLNQYIHYQPGHFETLEGKIIAKHDGAAFYTLGQRRGLGIGGPGEPWFVVGKDLGRNVVYLEQGERHAALYCDDLTAKELTWISGEAPVLPLKCHAKVRYRQPDQPCTIQSIDGGVARVVFDVPQRAVTPRQSVVFYQGDICLGGGLIEAAGLSYYEQGRLLPETVSV